MKDYKEIVKADLKPNSSRHLMSSELGKRWKSLDLETKQYYCQLAGQKKKDFYSQQKHFPSPSLSMNSQQELKVPEVFNREATPENTIGVRTDPYSLDTLFKKKISSY